MSRDRIGTVSNQETGQVGVGGLTVALRALPLTGGVAIVLAVPGLRYDVSTVILGTNPDAIAQALEELRQATLRLTQAPL